MTTSQVHSKKSAMVRSSSQKLPISGRVDKASTAETVDSGSIPGQVKPKTLKNGIQSFPA